MDTNPNTDDNEERITIPVARNDGTLEENMTANAYEKILPARYLIKNENGEVIEAPEEMITRVAKNVALAEAVWTDDSVQITPEHIKPGHPHREELIDKVFGKPGRSGGTVRADYVPLTERNVKYVSFDAVYDDLPDDTRQRVSEYAETFEDLMTELAFIPNTPTLMNAGTELQQLSACFVDSPDDDIVDIHETMTEAAQVFQSGGGMGYSFSRLRPYGDPVGSTGGIASGPITFMRTYDQMCETIAQGGTRRGAQMGVMSVSHPDVIEFINAKNKAVSLAHVLRLNDPDDYTYTSFNEALEEARDLIDDEGRVPKHLRNAVEGHLSNFNISVGITHDFMAAVRGRGVYRFENPRTGDPHVATRETKEMYSRYGLGDHVTVGEILEVPAQEIWTMIVEGAYENGEPGVIFLDRVNDEHSFDVEEHPDHEIIATNPCGEQALEEYEACNLGHINLSTIVHEDAPTWDEWLDENYGAYKTIDEHVIDLDTAAYHYLLDAIDYDELRRRVDLGVRFLDNVVTMSDFPIEKIEEKVRELRKIGLGIMGLAQMYVQLGVRYGSDEGNEIARQLMTVINQRSKAASYNLAEDRGMFDAWPVSKYANPQEYPEWFERQTGVDLGDPNQLWSDGYPMRNHNTTTIAPTGTTSMLANTTGGCEPMYNVVYYKNVTDDVQGDEMLVEFDSYFERVLEANGIDVDVVRDEAVDLMSANEFEGVGSLASVPDDISELFVTTGDLTAIEHASVQCALQKGVDSSISKTINAPADATRDDIDELLLYLDEHGAKGATIYRDGSRSKQVLTTRADNAEFSDGDLDGLSRDNALDLIEEIIDTHDLDVRLTWIAESHDDLDDETPEVGSSTVPDAGYATKRDRPDILRGTTQRVDTGYGRMYVNINNDEDGRPFELFANIGNSGGFTNSFTEALAKTISTALRSGVDPREIADDLTGIRSPKVAWDNAQQINSIPDAIGTALDRHLDHGSGTPRSRHDVSRSLETPEEDPRTDGGGDGLIVNPESKDRASRSVDAEPCPDCGSLDLRYTEGCKTCESCGWSEC